MQLLTSVRWYLDTDGSHYTQYDPSTVDILLGEAAALMRALGFAARHVTLIGGIVPTLLVPELDPGLPPHVGTADLDLCLSVAILAGDTAEYERLDTCLRRAGFQPSEQSWRWKGGSHIPVVVEFFCPAGIGRVPGRAFRPSATDNPRARRNLGSKLSALTLTTGALIGKDVQEVTREVTLPDGKGRLTVQLRVTGPTAYLAAKADALQNRDKPKDAYDIIWLLDAWPGGPRSLARVVRAQPISSDPLFGTTLSVLEDQFGDQDRAGAIAYARFLSSDEDPALLAQHAAGAVTELLRHVR